MLLEKHENEPSEVPFVRFASAETPLKFNFVYTILSVTARGDFARENGSNPSVQEGEKLLWSVHDGYFVTRRRDADDEVVRDFWHSLSEHKAAGRAAGVHCCEVAVALTTYDSIQCHEHAPSKGKLCTRTGPRISRERRSPFVLVTTLSDTMRP